MPPLKKQQSNMYCEEAVAVGLRKLVAVSVMVGSVSGSWWHPEAGGGGNATPLLSGWFYFLFLLQGNRCHCYHGPCEVFFKEHHCYCY